MSNQDTKFIETITVYGRSPEAWETARKEAAKLISAGYEQLDTTEDGGTFTLTFRETKERLKQERAIKMAADDFENVYLKAVELASEHYANMEPEKVASMIRIGAKIHEQRKLG